MILSVIVFYSCTKVVDINLNDASPQIVIEGNVTDSTGPYQVQITKTANYSSSNIFPPVSGAVVKITDNTSGKIDLLTEVASGIYKTNISKGIYGHTYQLNVVTSGQTYTASSTMPQLVVLDSITFQHNSFFNITAINPVANFQDPAGILNYYTFKQTINSRQLYFTYYRNDRLSDGKYISQQIFPDSNYIKVGDNIKIQMNCVDKNVYNYFSTLWQATGNNVQTVTPTNPISNISNNALGYFSASTVMFKTKVAK